MSKPHTRNLRFSAAAVVILCCVGFFIYSNTFFAPFHFDDQDSITANPNIRDLSGIKAIWDYWPPRFITNLSFGFNYHFHQLNVFGYHLVNISIHIISSILVFYFILLIFSTPGMRGEDISRHSGLVAFFSALVFLAHPIQTQAVTYIVQRATSLATLFYLASLIFYIKSRLLEQRPVAGNIYYPASLIMAVMAMFTKEIAATLPFTVFLCEIHFFKAKNRIKLIKTAPFFVVLLTAFLIIIISKAPGILALKMAAEPVARISPESYLFTQFRVMVTYIRLVFLPINQNLDYDYPISTSLMHLPVLASFLLLAAILTTAIRWASKYRLVSFGIFWFFLTLAPESGVIPIRDVIFEHRLYLPMIGFSVFLAGLIYHRFAAKSARPAISILIALVMCYSMLTYSRNHIWKDDFRLWDDTVRKSPGKARPYIQRGNAYFDRGFIDNAILDYTRAVEINPGLVMGYYNRGNAYSAKDSFDEAIADYNKALGLNPGLGKVYHNRAAAYFYKKEYDKSWEDTRKAEGLGYQPKPGFLEELQKASAARE